MQSSTWDSNRSATAHVHLMRVREKAIRLEPAVHIALCVSRLMGRLVILFPGCVARASCLRLYVILMRHYTDSSALSISWRRFCEVVPVHRVRRLIDRWLLSPGAAAISLVLATAPLTSS